MKVIVAPEKCEDSTKPSVFLAGGVAGNGNWRSEIASQLDPYAGSLYNPCRDDYPILTPETANQQITWEFENLRQASAALFWFPAGSDCPISLFELGNVVTRTATRLFVGMHLQYPLRADVEARLSRYRPEVQVACTLHELADSVMQWMREIEEENRTCY